MRIYIGLRNIDGVQYGEGYYIVPMIKDGIRTAMVYANQKLTQYITCIRYTPSCWLRANIYGLER